MRIFFVVLSLITMFVACSSDKPLIDEGGDKSGTNQSIVGRWNFKSAKIVEIITSDADSKKRIEEDIIYDIDRDNLLFTDDGIIHLADSEYPDAIYATYSIKDNIISRYDGEYSYSQFSISGNTLSIYYDDTEYYKTLSFGSKVTKAVFVKVYKRG